MTSIPAEEHTNRSASLRSTFRWKPRQKIASHALKRADLRFGAWRRVQHYFYTRLLQQVRLPPTSPSIHSTRPAIAGKALLFQFFSLATARHRRKSPSFSIFLSGHCYCVFLSPESPLFLCFLELYNIFRTLGVVSVDSY